MTKIIIGLSGEIASGKGTVAKYIREKYHANSYRFSTMLRDAMNRLYIEQNRENIATFSTMLRKSFGEDLFAKVMAEDVKKDGSEIIVIDGIRRLADIEYLKKIPQFKFIYIEADIKKCYERIIKRDENTDDQGKTFDDFLEEHNLETEVQIKDLKQHADAILENNGTVEELYEKIDSIINENK
jgi:dephospho-CoA kinase